MLETFNPAQREAITYLNGPLLVLVPYYHVSGKFSL